MDRLRIGNRIAVAAALAATAVVLPAPAYAEPVVDPAAVTRLVRDFAEHNGYPGIAVAITRGTSVVHTAGFGHDSTGTPLTPTTQMPIASVSKPFTALAVMQLVEAGRMSLDAPVREYLPEFRIADRRGERITVRHLLSQTSGITDRTLPEKSLPQPDSPAGAVVRAGRATLATEPGAKHAYSNTNYHIAARLVEVVAGIPVNEYLRRHIFEPLGMRSTTAIDRTPSELPDSFAKGHFYAYGMAIAATEPDRFVGGSDGVLTTAEDLARWLIPQRNGGVSANGTRLVSAEGLATMHRPADADSGYGLGWDTDDEGRTRHDGIWFTYSASVMLSAEYGIAVIGNTGIGLSNLGTSALAKQLTALVTGSGTGQSGGGAPVRLIVDLVLAGLTVVSIMLGIRNLRRVRTWTQRRGDRPVWRLAIRLAPRLLPAILLIRLPELLSWLLTGGQRDITLLQVCYFAPALVAWIAVAAGLNLAVLTTRLVALVRRRRTGDAGSVGT